MGLCRSYVDSQVPNISNQSVALTTAGTAVLIPSVSTNSIYVTDIIMSNGVSQGTLSFGYGVGATAPTGAAINIQPLFIGATTTVGLNDFGTPIKINTNQNFLVTAVSTTTVSVTVCYYIAP